MFFFQFKTTYFYRVQAVPKQLSFVAYSFDINKLFEAILINSKLSSELRPIEHEIRKNTPNF